MPSLHMLDKQGNMLIMETNHNHNFHIAIIVRIFKSIRHVAIKLVTDAIFKVDIGKRGMFKQYPTSNNIYVAFILQNSTINHVNVRGKLLVILL